MTAPSHIRRERKEGKLAPASVGIGMKTWIPAALMVIALAGCNAQEAATAATGVDPASSSPPAAGQPEAQPGDTGGPEALTLNGEPSPVQHSPVTQRRELIWPAPTEATQRWAEADTMLERIQDMLPRPVEDVEALADHFDYDVEQAIAYVRDRVRFEPYAGVMRGPDGTAVTEAGNAWDQALLLAALIRTMGADAQVVSGRLEPDDAGRLLGMAFRPAPDRNIAFDREAIIGAVTSFDPSLAESLSRKLDDWEKASTGASIDDGVDTVSTALHALLDKAGVELTGDGSAAALVGQLSSDYAWVRWRDGPGDPWTDLHPAFADAPAPATQPERYLDGTVPAEFQHRVALRLWIERSDGSGSRAERIPIMDAFERPVAELSRRSLALGLTRISGEGDDSSALLVPVLGNGLAPGAQAVSALGLTAPPDAAGNQAAGLFSTVSGRFGDALGALSQADGGEDRKPRLTGVILTVERTAPGQEAVALERRIIDLRGTDGAGFPDSATFEMLFETDIGAQSTTQVAHRFITQMRALLQAAPTLFAFAQDAIDSTQLAQSPGYKALDKAYWTDWDVLSGEFIRSPSATEVAYRPGPLLASRRRTLDPDKKPLAVTDIFANPVAVLRRSAEGTISLDARAAMLQGIRDTVIESHLLPGTDGWAQRKPRRLVVDAVGLANDPDASNWAVPAREMALDDLARGHVLAIAESDEPHWWRIHRETGQTLGMGTHGGQEIAEYVVQIVAGAVTIALFYLAADDCAETYAHDQDMKECCIVGNLLVTGGLTLAGAGVAKAAGGAASHPDIQATFLANPIAASVGWITTALALDIPGQLIIDQATSKPIANACSAFLDG